MFENTLKLYDNLFAIEQHAEKLVKLEVLDNISLEYLTEHWANGIDSLFQALPEVEGCYLVKNEDQAWSKLAGQVPILTPFINQVLYQQQFYQLPLHWHKHNLSSHYPQRLIQSIKQVRLHPQRPPKPTGEVYSRFDCLVGKQISFRTFDLEKDINRFTDWMNDPRVAEFWEQAWSQEKLEEFIAERQNDSHIIPLIGEFDGYPFGYFEVYWVTEDRLAPYYDNEPYDRGIHLLVGEQAFRGPLFFKSWMRALTHYLFIDEQRTQRVVLEPRHDNQRLFCRIKDVGYRILFEFDFPHKTSALVMVEREAFFRQQFVVQMEAQSP
ncbi:acetyltransferase [Endozoicomonas sp. SM1973]|uniref:Acetyltransferase n=1 Tax=Spartinivicinus marinus TaxID=2994442 RepID=A0A853I8V7_9GAMM|nr:GNAT family N-acetyltransferase [Spartinivicinus marinus]MCX4028350.1 GNAT family N-acetyltransferase [Spartinivicinus marinus]NYZ65685.1 acetyltransferase [Spartinivicinus marinus]